MHAVYSFASREVNNPSLKIFISIVKTVFKQVSKHLQKVHYDT